MPVLMLIPLGIYDFCLLKQAYSTDQGLHILSSSAAILTLFIFKLHWCSAPDLVHQEALKEESSSISLSISLYCHIGYIAIYIAITACL